MEKNIQLSYEFMLGLMEGLAVWTGVEDGRIVSSSFFEIELDITFSTIFAIFSQLLVAGSLAHGTRRILLKPFIQAFHMKMMLASSLQVYLVMKTNRTNLCFIDLHSFFIDIPIFFLHI